MTPSAGVHWLTGTTYLEDIDVLDVVHEVTGGADFVVIEGSKWAYGKRYRTVEGIEVLVDPSQPENMPPVCVNVPGAGCEFLGAERLRELASILKPTRIDFAWDGVPFAVEDVAGWIDSRDMRTRFRSSRKYSTLMGDGGGGVSLGSKSSTGEVVVYDRRGPVRLEMRLRGERAELAYEMLMAPAGAWSEMFLGVLRGLVDFVDRSGTSRADRAPLLPLWGKFVAGATRAVVALTGSAVPSLDRVTAWIEHQVAKRLHMLAAAGVSIGELLALGKSRMRKSDRVMLAGWCALAP